MSEVNLSSALKINRGGASRHRVGLTAAQDEKAFGLDGGSGVEAWKRLSHTSGATIVPDYGQTETLRNDNGELLGEEAQYDEVLITLTLMQSDAATQKFRRNMVGEFFPLVIPRPIKTLSGGENVQLHYFPKCTVVRDTSGLTLADANAELQIVFRASKNDADVLHVIEDVDYADETSWPASLDGAKLAEFAAA